MTAKQIARKLATAGIELAGITIERDEVTVCVGYSESNGYGQCNDRKTNALANKVSKALGGWGGFSTGYGARVLQASTLDMGDFNDKSSRWHY